MDFETKAAYRLVLDFIYMQGGNLPDDARYISGLLGCSVKKWNGLREALISTGRVIVRNGYLGNLRADKELETLGKFQDKQRENRARPNKNKAEQSPRSDHTEPDTDKDTIANAIVERTGAPTTNPEQPNRSGKPRGSARGSRIDPSWTPTPTDYAFASKEGLSREEINREADRFRDYWTAKSGRDACKTDWAATWRNWLRSDFRKPSRASVAATVNAPRGAFDRVVGRLDEIPPSGPEPGRANLGAFDAAAIDGEFSVVPSSDGPGADWSDSGSDQTDAGSLFAQRRAGYGS